MSERTPAPRVARLARRHAIAVLLVLGVSACARSDEAWVRELSDRHSEPFERGLAAIALAEQSKDGLDGVPTILIEAIEHTPEGLGGPAREAFLAIGPAALPEMAECLVTKSFVGDSEAALRAAIARHGAAAIPPLVDAMPELADAGSRRVGSVVAMIGAPAVDPLIAILRQGPKERTARAAFLLGSLGRDAERALDELLAVATGSDAELAKIALASLYPANPLGWRIEAVLRTALRHPDPGIRDAAVESLARVLVERGGRLPPGIAPKRRTEALLEAARLGEAADRAFVDSLVPIRSARAVFASEVLRLRAAAWSIAPGSGRDAGRSLGDVENALSRADPVERRLAALEIGRRGREGIPAVPALLAAIEVPDEGLQFCAALSLALVVADAGRTSALGPPTGDGVSR